MLAALPCFDFSLTVPMCMQVLFKGILIHIQRAGHYCTFRRTLIATHALGVCGGARKLAGKVK